MGSISIKVLIRYFFPCSLKMRVFDVLHHLVTYLWTKRYKCCIKSANYVMLTYVRCIVGLLNRGFCHVNTVGFTCFLFIFVNVFNLNVPYIYFFFYPTCYISESLTGWLYFADVVLPLPEYIARSPP